MNTAEKLRRRISRLEDSLGTLVELILNVEDAEGVDEQYEARKTLINELVTIKDQLNDDQTLSYYDQ